MSEIPRAETPRVNAFLKRPYVAWDGMWIRFAEQLERELAETKAAWIPAHRIGEFPELHAKWIMVATVEYAHPVAGFYSTRAAEDDNDGRWTVMGGFCMVDVTHFMPMPGMPEKPLDNTGDV